MYIDVSILAVVNTLPYTRLLAHGIIIIIYKERMHHFIIMFSMISFLKCVKCIFISAKLHKETLPSISIFHPTVADPQASSEIEALCNAFPCADMCK